MKRLLGVGFCIWLVCGLAFGDTFGTGANQFTIDFVNISGDAGNLGSWPAGVYYTFSGVNHGDYRMGKFEITNGQWNKFKASIAPMRVTGSAWEAYESDPFWTGTNVPTNYVSWYEAAQFVNWLNTSKGYQAAYKFSGTQGTENYTPEVWQAGDTGYSASNPYRNSNAYYFLPTDDEWVKAAYWDGTSLQTWATINDTYPVAGVGSRYGSSAGGPWAVGSGSEELNGTFDMMGNVWEWMESWAYPNIQFADSTRSMRGSCYWDRESYLRSTYRDGLLPVDESPIVGFRVASIPEPGSAVLMLAGLGFLRKRRGKGIEVLSTRY
jgi:formylglycine-generating enzyme required for sulfatase activity